MHSALVGGGNSGIGYPFAGPFKRGYGHIGIVGRSGIHIDDIESRISRCLYAKRRFTGEPDNGTVRSV
jgi:short-subunit dehydrogenase involved in D-alanine esterification of teichoic acids